MKQISKIVTIIYVGLLGVDISFFSFFLIEMSTDIFNLIYFNLYEAIES